MIDETAMDLPYVLTHARVDPILSKSFRNQQVSTTENLSGIYWPAEHFRLHTDPTFNAATFVQKQEILRHCSASLLTEAYYIEKGGMFATSRMSLLSETLQERMLYSLFASDEATHFYWISQFTDEKLLGDYRENPFLVLLEEVSRTESKPVLTYLLQVVLEGWGIRHYHDLAKDCASASLRTVFENILKDEARHHGSGIVLANLKEFSADNLDRLVAILQKFLAMVQCGPQSVIAQLERVIGPLDFRERVNCFAQCDSEAQTQGKLDTLVDCMRTVKQSDVIIARLRSSGSLRAFTAQECAAIAAPHEKVR